MSTIVNMDLFLYLAFVMYSKHNRNIDNYNISLGLSQSISIAVHSDWDRFSDSLTLSRNYIRVMLATFSRFGRTNQKRKMIRHFIVETIGVSFTVLDFARSRSKECQTMLSANVAG